MGSEEAVRNRRIVERFIEGVLEGRLNVVDELCDPGLINHAAAPQARDGIDEPSASLVSLAQRCRISDGLTELGPAPPPGVARDNSMWFPRCAGDQWTLVHPLGCAKCANGRTGSGGLGRIRSMVR